MISVTITITITNARSLAPFISQQCHTSRTITVHKTLTVKMEGPVLLMHTEKILHFDAVQLLPIEKSPESHQQTIKKKKWSL